MSIITDKGTINLELLRENERLLAKIAMLLEEINRLNKQIDILFNSVGDGCE